MGKAERPAAAASFDLGMKRPATKKPPPPPKCRQQPALEEKGNKRQSHGRTCVNCRLHRVRCDQQYPCSRCFRLCIKCRPPVRKRRSTRVKGGSKGRSEDEESDADGSAQGPDELFIAAEAAAAATLEAHPLQDRLIDLVFQRARANPWALAEVVARAGIRLFRAGLTSRTLCVLQMRKWLIKSRICRGDATWGFLRTLMVEMGITQVELETAESLVLGPTEEMRRQLATREVQKIMGCMPEVQDSVAWRLLNDEGVAMYMNVIMEDGNLVEVSNSATKQWFRGVDELIGEDELKHGMLLNLLMLALVAPEDRDAFASSILEMSLCESPRSITHLIKGFNRQGEIGLYLIELRSLSSLRGAPPGYVMRIEPCPASQHVTATPGLRTAITPFRPKDTGGLRGSATTASVWPPRLASRLPQSNGETGSSTSASGSSASGRIGSGSRTVAPSRTSQPYEHSQKVILAPAVTGVAALPLSRPPTEMAGAESTRQLAALFSTAQGRAAVKQELQPPPLLPSPPPPPPLPPRSSGRSRSATGDKRVPDFDEALLEQVFDEAGDTSDESV